jgi:hypothetical protein
MPLMTDLQYRELTGDGTPATPPLLVDNAILWAERKMQEYLGRYITHGTYEETLELDRYGKAYPAAVPVTSVSASADVTMIGDDCMYFGPQWPEYDMLIERSTLLTYVTRTVSYTGGFTLDNAPTSLVDAICALVYYRIHHTYNPIDQQLFATQIRVGDVALGFDAKTRRKSLDAMVPGITDSVRGLHLGRL